MSTFRSPTGRVVLVTGAAHHIGAAVAGALAARPGVDRVIAVDAVLPDPAVRARLGGARYERVDIRTPAVGRLLHRFGVDTVVHAAASASPASAAARSLATEVNVLGTLQLLAACQRSPQVRVVVVRSSVAVYGSSPRDAAVASEDTPAHQIVGRAARDAVDIEETVRGFTRRRPDVRVHLPRLAEIIGPTVRTPVTRYFSLAPFVPAPAGQDARVQFLHESDAVGALVDLAVSAAPGGPVNVAGEGVLTVRQALHRAGRWVVPVPGAALSGVGRLLERAGVPGFSAAAVRALFTGRVVDTSRLREQGVLTVRYSSAAAFADFADGLSWGGARSGGRSADGPVGSPPRRHLAVVPDPAPAGAR